MTSAFFSSQLFPPAGFFLRGTATGLCFFFLLSAATGFSAPNTSSRYANIATSSYSSSSFLASTWFFVDNEVDLFCVGLV